MNRIRPEEMISVRNRRYPSGIDRIRCLKPLTFVIDVMNVDGGDERLTAHPDAPIQNGSSSFRWQNETRSNLPNLADNIHLQQTLICCTVCLQAPSILGCSIDISSYFTIVSYINHP